MSRLKIEGEGDGKNSVLFSSDIKINVEPDRLIKNMTLTVSANDVAVLEIEEYLVPSLNSEDHECMTMKTTHAVNFIDIETVGEVKTVKTVVDLDKQEMEKLKAVRESNFVSAIDDLEI